ncbi:MAG: hypothetical protein BGO49_10865 [Planctomycetales bacterium 71-10]|nr:MAG: hypothetical protein BGO49_10865 [Planctomycetales bacterium 71-10]
MKLFTIGFTKKSAETFFTRIKNSGARTLIDVRLNNVSQLAGFTKKNDLKYFTGEICKIDYLHLPVLAPTQDILTAFKTNKGDWGIYERQFLKLMEDRKIEAALTPEQLDGGCLLCSEEKPHHCHRRLVAEYLKERWKDVEIEHIP